MNSRAGLQKNSSVAGLIVMPDHSGSIIWPVLANHSLSAVSPTDSSTFTGTLFSFAKASAFSLSTISTVAGCCFQPTVPWGSDSDFFPYSFL